MTYTKVLLNRLSLSPSQNALRSIWLGFLTIFWTMGFWTMGIWTMGIGGTTRTILSSAQAVEQPIAEQNKNSHSLATLFTDVLPLPETKSTPSDPIGHLFQWIEKTACLAPEGESEAEQTAHLCKVARSIALAADRALNLNPNDEQAVQCHLFKLQALSELAELSNRTELHYGSERGNGSERSKLQADQLLENAIAAARTDKRPDVAAIGMKFLLDSSMAKWPTLRRDQKSVILHQVVQYISRSELQPNHIQVLMGVADFLDSMGENRLAAQLLNQALPHLKRPGNPEMGQCVAILEGLQRRLNLLGNKIKIAGTLLDGTPIDWTSYRGKIVLVNYWTTECGLCRAELPNVLKLYHAYHDKGFDVVGICLDSHQESVVTFLSHERIPWATLFCGQPSLRGWEHPLATYYGITGVPQAILIERDGTVVDMNARGEQLAQQLRKRLGKPLAKADLTQDVLVRQVSDHSVSE